MNLKSDNKSLFNGGVKVRVAPSPTGFLHIGTAQSALYNWLFAKKNNGSFYLRIEDTDKERSKKEYEDNIIEALTWLDIEWDGLSRSSDNNARYSELLKKLLSEGKAFYCHHTHDELEAERKDQENKKEPPRHVCAHKNSGQGSEAGGIVRLKVDETSDRVISFDDQIRGKVEFKQVLLGDFSIGRSADDALYHFAVVVDDADMQITHVLRGEDHISNTPKQILIYEALGFLVPMFGHLPLILAPDRSKMSKRHGETAVTAFRKDYLPEAIVNFLGALSYTFSKEIMTKDEMISEFDIHKVHKSGAIFDVKKLNWFNAEYIRKLSPSEFKKASGLGEIPDAAVPLITERLEKLSDAGEFSYLWSEPKYDKELLQWKDTPDHITIESLARAKGVVENWDFKDPLILKKRLDAIAGDSRGLVYWPLRVALSGKEKSPDPVQIATVIGKDETVIRINKAIQKLSSN